MPARVAGLTELDRVDVFERVEIDDCATLSVRDLFRQKAMPSRPSVAGAARVPASCRSV